MSSVAAEARSKIDVTAQQPQEGVKACVIKAYITQHAEDLSMEVDDIVIVLKTEGHRGFGSLNGKTGYFPLSHVRELNPGNSPGSDNSTSADEKQGWFRRTLGRRKNSSSSAESSSPRDSFYGGNSSYTSSPTITPRNRLSLNRSVSTGEPQRNSVVGSAVSEEVLNTDETLNFKNWVLSMGGPDEVQKLNLSKAEINRQEVIYEMAKTEQSYIKDLALVVEVYIKPLRKNNLIRPKDLTVIFSNWEQLLPLHQELFRLFEAKRMEKKIVGQVGEIWLKMSDYLKIYMMYCGNYAFALVNLEKLMAEKNFAKFCDACSATPECRNLSIHSYLIKPVQRICKYPLLLKELMKNTPTTHPDYPVLGQALLKVETVVTIVNEAGRQTEAIHKMLKLQTSFTTKVNIVSPTRQYIGAQTFDIMEYGSGANAAGKNSREVIMFNDMMVVAKVERAGKNDDKKYKHIGTIPYDTAILEVMSEQFEIQVPEEKRYYLFLCPDNESKVTWADKITKLIKAHRQQSRTPSQAVTSSPGQNTRAASMIVGQGSPVSAALAKELKNTNADHSSERDSDSGINVSSATSASSNTPPNTSRSNSQVLPSVSTPPQDQLTTLLSSSPALSNTKGPAKLTQMTSLVEDPEDIETHTESPSESASISESTTPALILPEMNIEETDSESNEHVTDQTSENRVQFLATPPPQLTLAISLGNLSFDGFSDPIDSEPETEEADQKSDKQGFGLLLPPPPKLTLALSSGNLSFDGIAGPIEFETTSNATDQKSENQKIESQKPKLESTPQQTLAVASVNVSSELNSSHYSLDELIGSQGSTHEALVTAEQNPSEVATEVNENEGSQISIDKIAGNQDSSHDILSDLINSQPEISIEASESRGSISIDRIARDQISSYDIPSESVISMPQSSVEASTNEGGPISIDQIAAKQESCNNNPSESVTSPPESSKEVTESEGNRISIDKIVEDKDSSHDIASDSVPSPPESSIEASEREGSRISIDQIAAKQDSSHDIPSELVTSPPESSIEASESKGSLISIDKIAAKQDSSHNIPLDSVTSPPEISREASESQGSRISVEQIAAKQDSSHDIPSEAVISMPQSSIEASESEGSRISVEQIAAKQDPSHDNPSDSVTSPPESSVESSESKGSRISIDKIAENQDSCDDDPSEPVTSPPESSIEASEREGSRISIDKIAENQDSCDNDPSEPVTSPPESSIEASESKGSLISIDKIVAKQNSSDDIPPESDSLPERSIEVSESEGKQVSIDHVPDTQESSQEVHTQVDSDSSTVVLIEAPSSANTLSTSTLSVERPSIRERSRTAPLNTPSTLRNQISFNDPSPAASTEILTDPSFAQSEVQEKPSFRLATEFENKNSFSAPTSPIEKIAPPELTRTIVPRNRPASVFVGSNLAEYNSTDKINASSTTLKELDDEDERNERSGESVTDIPEKLLSRRSTQHFATSFSKPIMTSIIIGVYKPSEHTKDYIYVVETTHVSVAQSFLSFHTFDDFFDFHLQLIGHFPEEAGLNVHNLITLPKSLHSGNVSADTTEKLRIIPEFPPQMMMVNDAIARSRLLKLQEYLNSVIKLPPKISRAPTTYAFFKQDGRRAQSILNKLCPSNVSTNGKPDTPQPSSKS